MLGFETPGFRTQFEHRDGGSVVDPDLGATQAAGGAREAWKVFVPELPGTEPLEVDEALRRQQSLYELLARHLQGKDRHRCLVIDGRVGSHVEAE